MTIIVAYQGVMAADSAAFQSNVRIQSAYPKILRMQNGGLVAAAGCAVDCMRLRMWAADGAEKFKALETESLHGVMMEPDGRVWWCDDKLRWMPEHGGTFAGEYENIAFCRGAIAAGADAETAVRLCCERMVWCGGPVQVERL